LIMLLFNTIRLDWIIYYSIDNPQDFEFIHNTLGRYIFAIIPLILFYIFARNQKNLQY
jgi:exosortase/archaeosortase family protein